MVIRDISGGKISGTGTLACENGLVGGVLISADGTNAAVVILRHTNSTGDILFDISTETPMFVGAPIKAAKTIYYSITGTGASAQLFEWVE